MKRYIEDVEKYAPVVSSKKKNRMSLWISSIFDSTEYWYYGRCWSQLEDTLIILAILCIDVILLILLLFVK